MKKELFLAITIGFILGLIITGGIYVANKSLKGLPTDSQAQPTPEPTAAQVTPTPQPSTNSSLLTVSAPENELLTDKSSVTVSGKAQVGSTVVVTGENSEEVLAPDATGAFTTTVDLESGYNTITIVAFDKTGVQAKTVLTVTYSTAKI